MTTTLITTAAAKQASTVEEGTMCTEREGKRRRRRVHGGGIGAPGEQGHEYINHTHSENTRWLAGPGIPGWLVVVEQEVYFANHATDVCQMADHLDGEERAVVVVDHRQGRGD